MNWFKKQQEVVQRKPQQDLSKRKSCKIKVKKTSDGEIVEYSEGCTEKHIEAFLRAREEREAVR